MQGTTFQNVYGSKKIPEYNWPIWRLATYLLLKHPVSNVNSHGRHICSPSRFHIDVLVPHPLGPMLQNHTQNSYCSKFNYYALWYTNYRKQHLMCTMCALLDLTPNALPVGAQHMVIQCLRCTMCALLDLTPNAPPVGAQHMVIQCLRGAVSTLNWSKRWKKVIKNWGN